MKIERISDKQIRCTLDSDDLSRRGMRLSELSYGTENARNLFREMLRKASSQLGFEPEDSALMMEAVPLSADKIMLIITKVDEPEELDARFSHFSPFDETQQPADTPDPLDGADTLLQILTKDLLNQDRSQTVTDENADFANMLNAVRAAAENDSPEDASTQEPESAAKPKPAKGKQRKTKPRTVRAIRFFAFPDLDTVIDAAKAADPEFAGESVLMKDPANSTYYLILRESKPEEIAFFRCCNRMMEFATPVRGKIGTEAHFREHYETIIAKQALQKLSGI